ncbi:hypothetical protein KUL49_03140 [Alteromonas sp. KUL49]|nr:hypothetical protein KUL49_03140 [Alteromonas sp. KUL49]
MARSETVSAVTESLGKLQYVDDNGQVTGFATDVARAVAERAGVELDIAVMPWARAYKVAQEQSNTLIFSIARTPSREEQFLWVGILCQTPMFVWGTQEHADANYQSFEELRTQSFVVTQGSRMDAYLKQHRVKQLTSVANQEQILGMILRGRVDFTITSDFMMAEKIAKHGFAPNDFVPVFKLDDMDNPLSLAFGLDTSSELYEAFLNAFNELQSENVIADISKKWGTSCR